MNLSFFILLFATYKIYRGLVYLRIQFKKPKYSRGVYGIPKYEDLAQLQDNAFEDWNIFVRNKLESYYRASFVYAVANILLTSIELLCLWHQMNQNFIFYVTSESFWLVWNCYILYKLLKLKNKNKLKTWRTQSFVMQTNTIDGGFEEDVTLKKLQKQKSDRKKSLKFKELVNKRQNRSKYSVDQSQKSQRLLISKSSLQQKS